VVRRADLIKTMAQRIRGKNSRRNYKRRRREEQRRALEAAKQSAVIVPALRPPVGNDQIVDYYPSVIVPKPAATPDPIPTPTPVVTPPTVILTECDKRLLNILTNPGEFEAFKQKVQGQTENKLFIVS